MGLWGLCHLLFEQGSQTVSLRMGCSWQIILFGPHSFWKIGTFHIKIHFPTTLNKKKQQMIWQSSTAIFPPWQNWLELSHSCPLYMGVPFTSPLPIPCCLKFSSLQYAGHLAPGFRGAMWYCSNHLSPSPHYILFGRSFLYLILGVVAGFFFFFSCLSRWIFLFFVIWCILWPPFLFILFLCI